MPPRLKLHDLKRILGTYGVSCDPSRGKGGHVLFFKGSLSYPVPGNRGDVADCYVKGARRKFSLTAADGISDREFFSR